jgi:hypothetical protein
VASVHDRDVGPEEVREAIPPMRIPRFDGEEDQEREVLGGFEPDRRAIRREEGRLAHAPEVVERRHGDSYRVRTTRPCDGRLNGSSNPLRGEISRPKCQFGSLSCSDFRLAI